MRIRPFRADDEVAVVALWEQCGLTHSWNNPSKDIARKLKVDAELFLVGVIEGEIVASVMGGYDGHRGWINYLSVAPQFQRRGLGAQLMAEIEGVLDGRGCAKINLQIRSSNEAAAGFYRALGYSLDDVISMGKRLERDD